MANVDKKFTGFTKEEQDAMKARAKELVAEARLNKTKAEGEREALDAIVALAEPERTMAGRIHEIVMATAPSLSPKTWYGMPAYTLDGKVVCFFQSSQKFKTRYATFGFNESAKLDDGNMWPVAFAITKLTETEEARIVELVKKAII